MSWFARWFSDSMYMDLYSHRDAAEARDAVHLFHRATGLTPDGATRLLDLACGTGRHAFEFARMGYRVVATDLSATLLSVAIRKTRKFHDSVALVRGDMRHLPFTSAFDAVAQLFTAFGYFVTDEENEAVIAEVGRILHPGGWYMLDFLNADVVRRSIVPDSEDTVGGCIVRQQRWIRDGRVEKRITIQESDGAREYRESVRLYTRDELRAMLARNGFVLRSEYGAYNGSSFCGASPRYIVFSERLP